MRVWRCRGSPHRRLHHPPHRHDHRHGQVCEIVASFLIAISAYWISATGCFDSISVASHHGGPGARQPACSAPIHRPVQWWARPAAANVGCVQSPFGVRRSAFGVRESGERLRVRTKPTHADGALQLQRTAWRFSDLRGHSTPSTRSCFRAGRRTPGAPCRIVDHVKTARRNSGAWAPHDGAVVTRAARCIGALTCSPCTRGCGPATVGGRGFGAAMEAIGSPITTAGGARGENRGIAASCGITKFLHRRRQ